MRLDRVVLRVELTFLPSCVFSVALAGCVYQKKSFLYRAYRGIVGSERS